VGWAEPEGEGNATYPCYTQVMKWTKDKPTLKTAKPGELYWFKGSIGYSPYVRGFPSPTVVEIFSNGSSL